MELSQIIVRPVHRAEESRFQELMQTYHYLGALPKIGNTIFWYVAIHNDEWVALMSYSAAALKCGVRDHWIGWGFRHQYDRLHLVANNSRFLILAEHHHMNLASKILSLCKRRIQHDWVDRFGYPLLLMETFVDPSRFVGTIYQAANWKFIGKTKGYQRIRNGYSNSRHIQKLVFVQALQRNTRTLLSGHSLTNRYKAGGARMKLTAEQMCSLPGFFREMKDPRRAQGQRHRIHVVLAIAAGAILCGMRGYKDEDRSRIAKGYGPENITRLRRFAVGLLKSKGVQNVSQKMRQLSLTPRMVLDYLKMTRNGRCASTA